MHDLVPFVKGMIEDRLIAFMLEVLRETDQQRLENAAEEWRSLQQEILSYPHKTKVLRLFKNALRNFVRALSKEDASGLMQPYRKKVVKQEEPVDVSELHPENLELFIPKSVFRTSVYGTKYVGAVVSKLIKLSKYQKQLRAFLEAQPVKDRTLSQRQDGLSRQLNLLKECLAEVSRINTKVRLSRIDEETRRRAEAATTRIVEKDSRAFVKLIAEMQNFIIKTEQVLYCLYDFAHKYEPNGKGERITQTLYQLFEPYMTQLMKFIASNPDNLNPIEHATELLRLFQPMEQINYYMKEDDDISALAEYMINVPKQKDFALCYKKTPRTASTTNIHVAGRCLEQQGLDRECASIVSGSQGFYFIQIVQNVTRWRLLCRELVKLLSRAKIEEKEKKHLTRFCKQIKEMSANVYFWSPLDWKEISLCNAAQQQLQQQALQQSSAPVSKPSILSAASSLRKSSVAPTTSVQPRVSSTRSVLQQENKPVQVPEWKKNLIKKRKQKSLLTDASISTPMEKPSIPQWKALVLKKRLQKKQVVVEPQVIPVPEEEPLWKAQARKRRVQRLSAQKLTSQQQSISNQSQWVEKLRQKNKKAKQRRGF